MHFDIWMTSAFVLLSTLNNLIKQQLFYLHDMLQFGLKPQTAAVKLNQTKRVTVLLQTVLWVVAVSFLFTG